MATVINNPGGNGENSSTGLILGIVIAIILIVLFFIYGLPALRGGSAPAVNDAGIDLNVDLPTPGTGTPSPAPAQ